jgi:hypothetical protein
VRDVRPRAVALAMAAVLVVGGLGWLAHRTLYAPVPVTDLRPGPGGTPPLAVPVAPPPGVVPKLDRTGVRTLVPAWVRRTARVTGIPRAAVRAYARASLTAPDDCGLGWTTLAGVGWVETHHGTLGGRTLRADGRSSSTILGPALDGAGPFAAIPAAPGFVRWHGDATWDHAVGPMQFIGETWERWAVDGDGDGVRDPTDLDDAAATAAAYLCSRGGDLATSAGWTAGVWAYNQSTDYLHAVHDAATGYGTR